MDEKIRVKCTHCSRIFRERARNIRDGFQTNCPCCNRLVTFDVVCEDLNIRRAFRAARQLLDAQELSLKRRLAAQGWTSDRRQS